MEISKTQQAIALVDQGVKPFAAAREVGLSPNALYLALKKRREKMNLETCPCCGQVVREGFTVDHAKVKGGQGTAR